MNRNFFSFLPRKSVLALTAATLGTVALTGCGMGTSAVSTPEVSTIPAISGTIMGGETAVSGAKVILWETDPANSGYGVTATQLASTTSVTGGGFAFTPGSYTCAPGQFAYVTATGGDVTNGGGTINPNLVMIAAIGSCSNFSSSAAEAKIVIVINELSTVAAAYALGAFTSVNDNGSNGTQLVSIGAPANNNAVTGACTGTGASMTCTAAGLKHAFANAANLVDAVHFDGSAPSGMANITVPGNSSGSIPTAVINTLGNIMQFCTNSAGGTAGDGSNCGTFFTDAKPTALTAPANTLTAMVNVGHYPQHNIGTTCTGTSGGLFCLASAFPSFSPSLSALPHDWSIGIVYAGTTQGSFGVPQYLALDANDNVYVATGNLHAATSTGLAAMTSAGAGLWNDAQSANNCSIGSMAVDTNGNVFESIETSSTTTGCSYGIYGYSTASGALSYTFGPGSGKACNQTTPTSSNCPGFTAYDTVHPVQSTPNGIAIDSLNNLWYNRQSTTCAQCLQEFPYTSGSGYGAATTTEGFSSADWDSGSELVVDSTGNVYSSSLNTNVYITPNTSPSTPSTPAYTSSVSSNTGYISQPVGGTSFGTIAIDSAGNLWTSYASNYVEFTPNLTSGVITSYTAAAGSPFATAGATPHVGMFDGHDNLFTPQFSTGGLVYMQTSPSYSGYVSTGINAFTVGPCYVPSSATTCSATMSTSDPNVVQIDSTGAMWIAGTGASSTTVPGFVVQVIGTAYPTWPQLSYGKFGVEPQ